MFDLRTHIRDPKTGRVALSQPYSLHIVNGVRVFERGGSFSYEDGTAAPKPVTAKAGVIIEAKAPVIEPKAAQK